MRAQRPSYPHLLRNDLAKTSECKSIFGMLALIIALPLLLSACSPQGGSTTKNYYQNQMSGGGATKDPGDGTGGATGDGGGGQGVQCEDGSLYVRDIYEAVFEKDRTMKSVPGENIPNKISPQARKVLVDSLTSYFGPAAQYLPFIPEKVWIDIEDSIAFLEDDQELHPSKDANSPLKLKKGCEIVQIAYYDESPRNSKDDILYISRKRWKKLDQLNKIALLAHEVFFKQARLAGYKNSDAVRNQIGQLLSVDGLDTLFPEWVPSADPKVAKVLPASMNGFKYCEGTSEEDPTAQLRLYQYEGKDGKQHFSFPFLNSRKIKSALLQGASTSFSPDENSSLAAATDLLIFQSDINGSDIGFYETDALNRWYSESGLLTKPSYITNLFNERATAKIIWSETLLSSAEPISVSLENTLLDWDGIKTPKKLSPKGLIAAVNKELKDALIQCRPVQDLAEGDIALLHKEIKGAIERGQFPSNFPIWNDALKKVGSGGAGGAMCESLKSDYKFQHDLPALLYSIYLKTNTEADNWRVLGEKSLEPRTFTPLPLGVMSIRQGTNELKFTLSCEDYKTQYSRLASNFIKKPSAVTLNKEVTTDFKLNDFDGQKLDKNILVQKIRAFLTQKESESAILSFETFDKNSGEQRVRDGFQKMDNQKFLWELYAEKIIKLSDCDQRIGIYSPSAAGKDLGNACVVLTMQTTGNSYTTYFRYYNEGLPSDIIPEIEFVRFSPPSKTQH